MGVQHSKEQLDVMSRLRDFKAAPIFFFVGETEPERQLLRHEIDCLQSNGKLLQKTLQNEEKRLDRFDFVIELKTFP